MVAAAALFFSALRPQIEMLQPLDASACGRPAPIPPLPPVMTATRPERSKMLIRRFLWCFHLASRTSWFSMILSENRCPLFRIMLLDVRPEQGGVLGQP